MSNINPNPFTTRPEIDGTFGVVTSTHWIATAVGMGMLERGGNAFDAAVATAFTLQVVRAASQRPGRRRAGDRARHAQGQGPIEVICGQGPAPAGATIAHYKSLGLDLVPGTGLLACCVPGTFETWMLLLRDYGTMPLADVLEPAIFYAARRPAAGRARQRHHRRPSSSCSASTGRPRPRSICRAARCRRRARCSPTSARRDLFAHPARGRERRAAIATRRSSMRARCGRTALSPRRSTASAAPRR